jgi:hypothetical protein
MTAPPARARPLAYMPLNSPSTMQKSPPAMTPDTLPSATAANLPTAMPSISSARLLNMVEHTKRGNPLFHAKKSPEIGPGRLKRFRIL